MRQISPNVRHCLVSVHDGHLNIHQNNVIRIAREQEINGFLTVIGNRQLYFSELSFDGFSSHNLVHFVVFNEQQFERPMIGFGVVSGNVHQLRSFSQRRCFLEIQLHINGRSVTHNTRCPNFSALQSDQIFNDCKTQTRAFKNAVFGANPSKSFKNGIYFIGRNSDARIFNCKS